MSSGHPKCPSHAECLANGKFTPQACQTCEYWLLNLYNSNSINAAANILKWTQEHHFEWANTEDKDELMKKFNCLLQDEPETGEVNEDRAHDMESSSNQVLQGNNDKDYMEVDLDPTLFDDLSQLSSPPPTSPVPSMSGTSPNTPNTFDGFNFLDSDPSAHALKVLRDNNNNNNPNNNIKSSSQVNFRILDDNELTSGLGSLSPLDFLGSSSSRDNATIWKPIPPGASVHGHDGSFSLSYTDENGILCTHSPSSIELAKTPKGNFVWRHIFPEKAPAIAKIPPYTINSSLLEVLKAQGKLDSISSLTPANKIVKNSLDRYPSLKFIFLEYNENV